MKTSEYTEKLSRVADSLTNVTIVAGEVFTTLKAEVDHLSVENGKLTRALEVVYDITAQWPTDELLAGIRRVVIEALGKKL